MIHRRSRALIAALGAAGALAVPAVASASPVAEGAWMPVNSGSVNVGGYHIGGGVTDLATFDVDVSTHATWTGNLLTNLGWDSANVRQGAPLTVSRSTPFQTGSLKVSWNISGSVNPLGQGNVYFSTKSISDEAGCMPLTLGTSYECTAETPSVALVKTPGIPGSPYVKVRLRARFTITPEGVITSRSLSVGGSPAVPASSLSLSASPAWETRTLPCAPTGSDVAYRLGSPHFTPAVTATQQPTIQIGLMDPVLGLSEMPALYDHAFGLPSVSKPAFDLSGSGHTWDLGDLLANNVAPTIAPLGTFSGSAGEPVSFSANVSGRCDVESYVWKFSNGTTSYGPAPQRTFNAPGTYDGQLTVTDETGLKATRSFTVNVTA